MPLLLQDGNSTVVSVASKGRSSMAYDELEHERKVRKRRSRLIASAEEAFTHIRRMRENQLGENAWHISFLCCIELC